MRGLQAFLLREQLFQGAEAVAHGFPLVNQLPQDFGVGFGGGVKQHHRAVVGPGQKLGKGRLPGGLGEIGRAHV